MVRISKRMVILSLAVIMAASLLGACGKEQPKKEAETVKKTETKEQGTDTSKFVKLKMVVVGDKPKDSELVLEELNKKLKNDINANVDLTHVPLAEWQNKLPMIIASGEKIDVMYTAQWVGYKENVQKGAFRPLDELLPKYAPKSLAQTPKLAWDEVKVSGKIYMLPAVRKEFALRGFGIRGDLRKKYGVPEIKNLDDLGVFMEAIKKNEKDLIPFNAGGADIKNFINNYVQYSLDWAQNPLPGDVDAVYKLEDPGKVFLTHTTPEYREIINKTRKFYENGYWSKNILSNKVTSMDALVNGTSAVAVVTLASVNDFYNRVLAKNKDWNPEWYEWGVGTKVQQTAFSQNGLAIPVSAENPERGLMLIELLRTDESYNVLTYYGIKGKHYEFTSDGKAKFPEGKTSSEIGMLPDTFPTWGWKMDQFIRIPAESMPKYNVLMDDVGKRGVSPKLNAFTFIDEKVKSEMAAMKQVFNQYKLAVDWGTMDTNEGITILTQKMKEAGSEKFINELKKQIDTYLAENK